MNEYDASVEVCPHCGYVKGTPAKSRNHLEPGTMLIDRYLIGRCLGQGGFGITYIAWDSRLYKKVAIKEFMPTTLASRITGQMEITCYNEEAQERFRNGILRMLDESRRLARFNDLESVVKVYDCFEANGTAYIIMELLDGENIKDILEKKGKFDLTETIGIMTPVLLALREIHAARLIHRDISPDNIFLCKNGKVKLLDFGSARVASGEDDKSLSVILKPGYAPKEQYSGSAKQGPYTDVYAVCATIYKMLTGITPIDSLARRAGDDALEAIDTLAPVPHGMARVIMNGMALEAKDRPQTVDPLLDAFGKYNGDSGESPPKPPKPRSPKNKGLLKKVLIVLAAVTILAAVGFGINYWMQNRDDPDPDPTTEAAETVTEKQGGETLPLDEIPQPEERAKIESKYADSMTYTADDGAVYAVFTDKDDRVLLREQISLPKGSVRQYTLYSYTDDGLPLDAVTYLCADVPEDAASEKPADAVLSAERYTYNQDGALAEKKTFENLSLSLREVYTYDIDGMLSTVELWEDNTTQIGTKVYNYEDSAVTFVRQTDRKGTPVYESKTYASDGRKDETWFASDGTTKAKTVTREVKDDKLIRYTEKRYDRTERICTWDYDENGNLTAHTVSGVDGKGESAVRFRYDEDGALEEICLYDANDDMTLAYKTEDGAYTEYDYLKKGLMRLRAEYDTEGKQVSRIITEYDADDRKSKTTYYDENDEVTQYADYEGTPGEGGYCRTVYSKGGKKLREEYLSEKDEILTTVEFDANDHRTKVTNFNDDGSVASENVFRYDGDNLVYKSHSENGEIVYSAKYAYDGSGNWKEQYWYDANGNTIERIERGVINDRRFSGDSTMPKLEQHSDTIDDFFYD